MEETLTVHRLQLDDLLRRTLATTNPVEQEVLRLHRQPPASWLRSASRVAG